MRSRFLPRSAFPAVFLILISALCAPVLCASAGVARTPQRENNPADKISGSDAAPPLTEYDDVPSGMMMAAKEKTDDAVNPQNGPQNGDVDKIMTLADIDAAYDRGEYELVARHLEPIATDSYPSAEELLGIMYQKGQGVKKDPARALALLTSAANAGRPLAAHYLAIIYYTGDGVLKNPIYAVMWLYISVNAAAQKGAQASPDNQQAVQDLQNVLSQIGRRARLQGYEMAKTWVEKHNMVMTIPAP